MKENLEVATIVQSQEFSLESLQECHSNDDQPVASLCGR